jgi:hypothetical protein
VSDLLAQSLADGPHALLARLAGEWRGTARTWLEPGKLADTSPVRGSTRLILDGLFLLHEYEGALMGQPMRGLAVYGYSLAEKQWQSTWLDSVHNGTRIMQMAGEAGAEPAVINVRGHYPAPPGPDWGWRTTLEPRGEGLLVRHYNVTPDGQEALAVEFDYQRA